MHSISWRSPTLFRSPDPFSLLLVRVGVYLKPGCINHAEIIHLHTAKLKKKKEEGGGGEEEEDEEKGEVKSFLFFFF